MGTWKPWEKIVNGSFKGTPVLRTGGLGDSGFSVAVQDQAGNLNYYFLGGAEQFRHYPSGGAGVIDQVPNSMNRGFGAFVRGTDNRLYMPNSNQDGKPPWLLIKGPGQFLSDVVSSRGMDGSAVVFGEGLEHQLVYSYTDSTTFAAEGIPTWTDLGKPGLAGGKRGINGRPAVRYNTSQSGSGSHILARGQDNHLWHLFAKDSNNDAVIDNFGSWTNLGGGLTQPPVVCSSDDRIECFVIGEKQELYVKTWQNGSWGDFENLGGKLKGMPAAISLYTGNGTFVFGRGVNDELWYRWRKGDRWTRWTKVGDGLTGEPAVWEENRGNGGLVTCVVRRQHNELWGRSLRLSASEYSGQ